MPIIKSLLDNDLYKFTMQQCVLHQFPSAEAEYKLIVRSKVNINHLAKPLVDEIDYLCGLQINKNELDYLEAIRFIKKDYVAFLEDFRLKRRYVNVSQGKDQLEVRIKGPWVQTILFEVPLLAILSELYMGGIEATNLISFKTLENKLKSIQHTPDFHFADFGTRRRASACWQQMVVSICESKCPASMFIGTSNVHLAMKYGVKAIGTMAHEFIQAGQGLGVTRLSDSQKFMFETWAKEYRGDLGIALTDTIGMDAFLKDFDPYLAKLYDGCRQDSGDPIQWGKKLIAHYKSMGIDPMTKSAVFSDGLDFIKAKEILDHFRGRIKVSFGIGTNLTNDVGKKPLSIVIKLVGLNGNPVAKISDEPGKVICEDEGFLTYLKQVYGVRS